MADPRATQPVTAPPAQPGNTARHVKEVAGFELISRLGEGGMGQVFKARQRSIDRLVALKVLTPKLAEDKDYVERFEREAKAAGKLSHPNIVAVIDRGEDTTGPKAIRWIAFEFIDGSSLEGRIKKGRLGEREATKIVRDIAEALRYAGEKGLIHRDVKPDNILLTSDGTPKLADLGLAKFQNDNASLTQTGIVMGTPHYMAPEQALGERNLDIRADVYALGLVFYRCLTGELPWNADSALAILTRHINEDCPDPRALVPEISEGAVSLLRRMTARDRNNRAQPQEIIQTADNLLAGTAATLIVQAGVSGAVTGSLAKTGSSTRTQATLAETSSAARVPAKGKTGVQNTLAYSGAVGRSGATGIQSRAALVVAFLGCAAMSGMLMFVLVRHARRGGPAPVPDPAPVVTATTPNGPADDGPPKPPRPDDPKPDPEPTPPPPVAPPPPSLPEPDLSEADLTQLTSQVSHASQIAAALNAEAIADLQRDLTLYPKAADQLNVALQLVKLVGRATEDIKGASLHRPSLDGYQGELKGLGEALPKTRLADAVKAEVKGWADLLRAVDGLGKHLAGASGQRPRFSTGAPGVRAGCAKEWDEAVNKALYPALEEFDARNYDAAKKDAERAADRLDPNGPLLVALDAAKALSALCGAARGATSIDAFEQLKGSASVKGSCLALREVKLDLARTEAPQFSRAGWTQSDRGFASVAASLRPLTPRPLHEFFKKDTPGVVVGSSDYISQVRIKMTREKGALELIHVKDRYVFLGTDSSKRFPTKGFARVEADDAAKLEYKGSGVTEVQDFIFVPKSATEVELKVLVNGKEIASEDLATNDAVTLFGGHLVAKEYSVLVKRFPAASK